MFNNKAEYLEWRSSHSLEEQINLTVNPKKDHGIDWRSFLSEARGSVILEEAFDFVVEHNRRPKKDSKDEEERKLGIFLSNLKRTKMEFWYDSYHNLVTKYKLEWLFRDDSLDEFRRLLSYLKKHNKKPSDKKAKTPEEKLLGRLISCLIMSKNGRKGGYAWNSVHEEMVKAEGLCRFFESKKEIEIRKLNESITFFQLHNNKPSRYSKDDSEKKLGSFISKKSQARKGKGNNRKWPDTFDAIITERDAWGLFA